MSNKNYTTIERIIAKIDNDFNPDNSDWIPRVGAWCIDAMNMLKVLRTKEKKIKLLVKDNIALSPCPLEGVDFRVYDENGCEVKEANTITSKCGDCMNDSFTGEEVNTDTTILNGANTTGISYGLDANEAPEVISEHVNAHNINDRYNVKEVNYSSARKDKTYVKAGNNIIEINFKAKYIYIVTKAIETYKSTNHGCELPVIPNNGLLIEAITYYCMYKMLCRGYTHPVFNLHASQYGTNPFFMWNQLKDEAKRSVIVDEQGEIIEDGGLWRSALYINING